MVFLPWEVFISRGRLEDVVSKLVLMALTEKYRTEQRIKKQRRKKEKVQVTHNNKYSRIHSIPVSVG